MLRWATPFAAMGCVRILSWALREFRHFWCVRKQYRSKEFSEWIRSRSLSGRFTYRVLRLSGSVKTIEDLSHEGWRFLRSLHARGELVNELREKASARAAQESGTFSAVLLNFSAFKLLGSKRLCRVVSACVFVFFLPVTFWPLLLLDVERACVKALEVAPLHRNFDARRSRDDLAADARAWKRGFVAARAEWRGEYNDAFSAYWSLSADLLGGWGVLIAQLLVLVLVVEGCALLIIPWVPTPPPAVEALPARRMKSAALRRSSAARLQDLLATGTRQRSLSDRIEISWRSWQGKVWSQVWEELRKNPEEVVRFGLLATVWVFAIFVAGYCTLLVAASVWAMSSLCAAERHTWNASLRPLAEELAERAAQPARYFLLDYECVGFLDSLIPDQVYWWLSYTSGFLKLTSPLFLLRAIQSVYGYWSRYWERRKKIRDSQDRNFNQMVNFSLNLIESGKLSYRTLFEMPLSELLQGDTELSKLVLEAAEWTPAIEHAGDPSHPFVLWRMSKERAKSVNLFILNKLSGQNWFGFMAHDNGVRTFEQDYIFGLTCEKTREQHFNKLRVMVIREDTLRQIKVINYWTWWGKETKKEALRRSEEESLRPRSVSFKNGTLQVEREPSTDRLSRDDSSPALSEASLERCVAGQAPVKFEFPGGVNRWQTLCEMARLNHHNDMDANGKPGREWMRSVGRASVCVPAYASEKEEGICEAKRRRDPKLSFLGRWGDDDEKQARRIRAALSMRDSRRLSEITLRSKAMSSPGPSPMGRRSTASSIAEESSGSNWHGESPTRRAGSSRLGMQRAGSRG